MFPDVSDAYKTQVADFISATKKEASKPKTLEKLYEKFESLTKESKTLPKNMKKYSYYFKLQIAKEVRELKK